MEARPHLVLGYTTRSHLLLDLDNCSLLQAVGLAKLVMASWHQVGDCLVVLSSVSPLVPAYPEHYHDGVKLARTCSSYHLVFSAPIGYEACMEIIEVLAGLDVLNKDYVKIRQFRGDMTLRTSHRAEMKRTVMVPRPVKILWNRKARGHYDVPKEYFTHLEAGYMISH
jgi:hypothetical protein